MEQNVIVGEETKPTQNFSIESDKISFQVNKNEFIDMLLIQVWYETIGRTKLPSKIVLILFNTNKLIKLGVFNLRQLI